MKRMKKKVVAMVTLAMFMMTLLPMAAFAAVSESVAKTTVENMELSMENGSATADFTLELEKKVDNQNGNKVYLWLTDDATGQIYRYATIKTDNANWNPGVGNYLGAIEFDVQNLNKDSYTNGFKITKAGTYTLHAGILFSGQDTVALNDLTPINVAEGYNKIVVNPADVTVKTIDTDVFGSIQNKGGTLEYGVTPNSVAKKTVKVTAGAVYSDNELVSANPEGQVIAINNGNNSVRGIQVVDSKTGDAIDELTIDSNKTAKFDVKADKGTKAGKYYIYLTAGDVEYKLTVVVGESDVESIEVVETTGKVVSNESPDFEDVVEVVFKDAAGNVVEAPSVFTDSSDKADVFDVLAQPDANSNKLAATGLKLEKTDDSTDGDTYKLAVTAPKKLNLGDYTVRIALNEGTGDYVDVSFTVVKPGKATGLVIEMDNDEETVVSGGSVSGTVYTVDENGFKKPATASDIQVGFVNSIAVDQEFQGSGKTNLDIASNNGKFTVKAKSDEKYVGSKIVLLAFDGKKEAQVELTVVDGLSNNTLAFEGENGAVAKDNTVKVKVVDENGKVVNVTGDIYATVESSSDDTAKVEAVEKVSVTKGVGELTVFSNVKTTADIVVRVKDTNSNNIYANTLKYTFGEEDIPADTSVVMTLGSTEMLVNNEIVDMKDAAPFAQDNRTFVPFRALGEALDAQVEYDKDAKTVTYSLGSTEIVMTLDSKTYTVNGAEKTMDVAPFAKDNRTYVPVRFVGEALGFKVTGLQNGAGQYVGVAFTK